VDYLVLDKSTLIWFVFTVYAVSALFIVPNVMNLRSADIAEDLDRNDLQFASRLVLRIALILPMLSIVKNAV